MKTAAKTTYTVNEAAAKYRRTTARIRQICLQHDIGESVQDRIRILSPADFARIGQIIAESGHNRL
jgi:5'-deoxynucleotidase YfbR-like HD superfamily hydrolase